MSSLFHVLQAYKLRILLYLLEFFQSRACKNPIGSRTVDTYTNRAPYDFLYIRESEIPL